MYRIKKETSLTEKQIVYFIQKHLANIQRFTKLKDYYIGKQEILNRTYIDATKPNNKVVNPFGNYITDSFVGYFMGKPVSYKATAGNEEFLERVQDIFNYNDEQEENAELAKNASIYGVAYELLYMDSDANIRFKALQTEEIIPIYDDTIEDNLVSVIRVYKDTTEQLESFIPEYRNYKVEVYTDTNIYYYDFAGGSLKFTGIDEHLFKEVPVIVYENNSEETGDFEAVISLIDAYDKLNSDSLNDFEAFVDCYLVLKGMEGTETEDISAMKQNRVMLLPEGEASAEWLTKNQPDTYIENLKNRIENNIHKFSKVPNMNDENFANNASGVAIKFKLTAMENATSKKERKFKKGLQRRIELITNIFYLLGTTYDYRVITPVFSRNLPSNITEIADTLNKVQGLISEETAISLLPFVDNPAEELERKKKESQSKEPEFDIFAGNNAEEVIENE